MWDTFWKVIVFWYLPNFTVYLDIWFFVHGDLLTNNVLDADFNITTFIKVK